MIRRALLLSLLIPLVFCCRPPEAKAIEPVTMALLAPIALQLAAKAQPYIVRGLKKGLQGLLVMGKDTLEILYLPLGVIQSTVLMPFYFSDGVTNMIKGFVAPFKLCFHALLLPVALLGVDVY